MFCLKCNILCIFVIHLKSIIMKNLIFIVTFQIGVDVLGFIKNWNHEHWAIDVQSKHMKSNTALCNKGFVYQCSQYESKHI